MEQNQFEGLEEVEVADVKPEEDVENLKEYEKLLLAERDREDNEKALNLIKFGCFNQKEETVVDFSKLEKIQTPKKYKGLYTLYRNLETMQLEFIAELIENNKGAEDERKDLKPYAYDVIYLEAMDDETYKAVCHAGKNNVRTSISVLYKSSFVCFFVLAAFALYCFIYNLISLQGGFFDRLALGLYYAAPFFVGIFILLPLLVLVSIKYKKYKDQ